MQAPSALLTARVSPARRRILFLFSFFSRDGASSSSLSAPRPRCPSLSRATAPSLLLHATAYLSMSLQELATGGSALVEISLSLSLRTSEAQRPRLSRARRRLLLVLFTRRRISLRLRGLRLGASGPPAGTSLVFLGLSLSPISIHPFRVSSLSLSPSAFWASLSFSLLLHFLHLFVFLFSGPASQQGPFFVSLSARPSRDGRWGFCLPALASRDLLTLGGV